MKDMKERISNFSQYLHELMDPEIFPDVQKAVERKDKDSLVEICRRSKTPEAYIGTIVSVLLSVGPRQKWPMPQF